MKLLSIAPSHRFIFVYIKGILSLICDLFLIRSTRPNFGCWKNTRRLINVMMDSC